MVEESTVDGTAKAFKAIVDAMSPDMVENALKRGMEDNTQETNESGSKFAKMAMPASVMDFLMEHYGLFDIQETSMISFYILKSFAHMENDGFKLAIFKSTKDESGKELVSESFGIDIHDMIAKFRIGLATSKNKETTNEKDNM